MEFATLTRRVAEFSGADPAEIEPDPKLRAGIAGPHAQRGEEDAGLDPAAVGGAAGMAGVGGTAGMVGAAGMASPPAAGPPRGEAASTRAPGAATAQGGPRRAWGRPGRDEAGGPAFTPQALAAERVAAAKPAKLDRSRYETVRSVERLHQWLARAGDLGAVAFTPQTTSLDPMQAELCGVALAVAANEACYVPLAHRHCGDGPPALPLLPAEEGTGAGEIAPGQIAAAEALAAIKPLLEERGVLKVGHNLKSGWLVLARHGIEIAPFDDTMLMSYVLDAGRRAHGIDAMAEEWLGHRTIHYGDVAGTGKAQVCFDNVAIDKATEYAAEDADVTLRLWRLLKPRLVAEHMLTVYESLERPLVPVLARMERRGIEIERAELARLSNDFARKAAALEDEIKGLAGEPLNPGSPKQIGDILFGKMGLAGARKTKTGAWSTSVSVLEDLAEEGHKLPQKIIEWRQVAKLRSTYTDALPGFVNPKTRRVHTGYALAATTTGRLSSSEPNLQNIPIRTEEGRKIRRAFVAAPGQALVSADYSQIELRLLAEIADIPALKQAFRDGLDIHAMTASEMFGVPVEAMPGEVRRRAKAINFGIIYGISAFGLANQLGISREEAGDYIKKYFERFPGIRGYMEATRDACRKQGYVTTLFGRKCHYPDITASNPSVRAFNERAAINARLQGTAADIIRRAMVRMDEALACARLAARMLLQVHDELVFEAPQAEIAATLPVITRVMEEAPLPAIALTVPLRADAHAAANWDAAH
jgi:DNA polymerase-1